MSLVPNDPEDNSLAPVLALALITLSIAVSTCEYHYSKTEEVRQVPTQVPVQVPVQQSAGYRVVPAPIININNEIEI